MWFRRFQSPSHHSVFLGLMVASAVLLFLPFDVLRPARSMTQLVALPQWAVRQTTAQVAEQVRSLRSESVPATQYAESQRHTLALQNEVASLRQQLIDAQTTVQELTRIRNRGLPANTLLVPARVIGLDAAAGRDSMVVGKISSLKARPGDWVTSRLFLDEGKDGGVRDELAVLARECLIGWVEQSATFSSRVVLLSDRLSNRAMQVRIQAADDRKQPRLLINGKLAVFVLAGAGQGTMRISDVPASLVDAGRIRVGDVVTSDPSNSRLPVSVVIGRISDLRHNRKKPLFYDAVVTSFVDPGTLSQVYVVSLSQ